MGTAEETERETDLEPATLSLEGLDLPAVWRASWDCEHFVSSYRVVEKASAFDDSGLRRWRMRRSSSGKTGGKWPETRPASAASVSIAIATWFDSRAPTPNLAWTVIRKASR